MNSTTEREERLFEKLYRDLGNEIISCLENVDVNEIMLNPDGKLWIDTVSKGQQYLGDLNESQAYSIINGLAGIHEFVVSYTSPQLEAEFPYYRSMKKERFTAQVPPIVPSPSFTIRKKSEMIFTLEDYIKSQRITAKQAETLIGFIKNRKNILVCGGPGTGKTTVTNALIIEAVKFSLNQRFIILEDLPELQCSAENKVTMLTCRNVNMTSLLKSSMRMRPDRILIGEVRGSEALDMLKAWNTGCPGGISTVHANGAKEAIQRIIDLSMEAGLTVPPISLVLQTIDVIVSVERNGNQKGFINEILTIKEYKNGEFTFEKVA